METENLSRTIKLYLSLIDFGTYRLSTIEEGPLCMSVYQDLVGVYTLGVRKKGQTIWQVIVQSLTDDKILVNFTPSMGVSIQDIHDCVEDMAKSICAEEKQLTFVSGRSLVSQVYSSSVRSTLTSNM